jgi:hypothetical protein
MSEERYKNGKIYTIRYRGDDSLIYVGSTCLPLYKRWYKHKSFIFNEKSNKYNYYIYKTIRETNDFESWYIELYEEYECENKEQLLKREGEIIREIGTLNSKIAGRTEKEYRDDNKAILSAKTKIYYENNKDTVLKQQKENYEKNKETILSKQRDYYKENRTKKLDYQKEYRENNEDKLSDYRKNYYEKNKDEIIEKNKEYRYEHKLEKAEIDRKYYEQNKEKISAKQKEIVICECGCKIRKSNITTHKKTKKHLDLFNSNLNVSELIL